MSSERYQEEFHIRPVGFKDRLDVSVDYPLWLQLHILHQDQQQPLQLHRHLQLRDVPLWARLPGGPLWVRGRVRSTTSTSVPAVRPKASRCAAAVENAAVTSACATNQSSAKSTAPSASVTTSPVPDTRAYCAQVRWNNLFPYLVATLNFKEEILHFKSFSISVQNVEVYGPCPNFSELSQTIRLICLAMGLFGMLRCAQCIWSVLAK